VSNLFLWAKDILRTELVEPAVLTPPTQTSQPQHSLVLLAVELLRILRHPAVHGSIADGTWLFDPGRTPSSSCYNTLGQICPNMRSPMFISGNFPDTPPGRASSPLPATIMLRQAEPSFYHTPTRPAAVQTQEARPGRAVFFFPIVSILENQRCNTTRVTRGPSQHHRDRSLTRLICSLLTPALQHFQSPVSR
jgi:hypothetical protein